MLFEHVSLKVACNVLLQAALDAIELEHRKEMSAVVQIALQSHWSKVSLNNMLLEQCSMNMCFLRVHAMLYIYIGTYN